MDGRSIGAVLWWQDEIWCEVCVSITCGNTALPPPPSPSTHHFSESPPKHQFQKRLVKMVGDFTHRFWWVKMVTYRFWWVLADRELEGSSSF